MDNPTGWVPCLPSVPSCPSRNSLPDRGGWWMDSGELIGGRLLSLSHHEMCLAVTTSCSLHAPPTQALPQTSYTINNIVKWDSVGASDNTPPPPRPAPSPTPGLYGTWSTVTGERTGGRGCDGWGLSEWWFYTLSASGHLQGENIYSHITYQSGYDGGGGGEREKERTNERRNGEK